MIAVMAAGHTLCGRINEIRNQSQITRLRVFGILDLVAGALGSGIGDFS